MPFGQFNLNLLFVFEGRAPRSEYWTMSVVLFGNSVVAWLALLAIGYIFRQAEALQLAAPLLLGLVLIYLLLAFIATLAITVRRFHDRNKSAWWLLIGLIPYLGALWMFIELGFLKGTKGPNRYGDDLYQERPGRIFKIL